MFLDSGAREQAWDKNLQLLLVAIIAFNVVPHVGSIPLWATLIAAIFLSWKALSLFRNVWRPPRALLYLVSFCCSIGVFLEYHTILGQEAAAALLVTLSSAKLLETNRYRDAMFVIFTSFFLLMAHLLDSQTILTTIYMAVDVMLITALMFQLHKQERRRSARSFRPVMKTLLLAIPVWVFLFVAFPRFQAGLWGQKDRTSNQAGGFSDDLDPGGIETLTQDDEIAFRVQMAPGTKIPSLANMYWRGQILTVGQGLQWRKSNDRYAALETTVPGGGTTEPVSPTSYQVFLEPRFNNWIFSLDYPRAITMHQQYLVRKRPGFTYENMRPGSGQVIYEGFSLRESPKQRLFNDDRNAMLQLPDDLDPRVRALASELRDDAAKMPESHRLPTLADRIGFRVEKWFDAQGFRYTKSPGALNARGGSAQLTEFLFERKKGFCEHYAASFATLMRAAGIPARVTVGFLGAQKNPYGDYFVVRDLDAHAWTEIWRDDPDKPGVGQWVRVDPTELIAPLRLEMGGDFNLLDPSTYSKNLTEAEAQMRLQLHNSRLVNQLASLWDAAQMKWTLFLNDYDFDFQKAFLEGFGLKNVTRGMLFLIALFGVALFALSLSIVLRRRAHKADPVLTAWRKFCTKLERAGVHRRETEGPLDFTSRAAAALPLSAAEIKSLGLHFAELRYGPAGPGALREFRRGVKSLRLKKSS